ncbi:MAG: 30S ribosomal protein S1 [Gammaproteobacteria bacterium]
MNEPQFAELFEEFAKQRRLEEGTDLLAQVRDINENYVVVNAGLKSEAHIPREEFQDGGNGLEVAVGDEVEVEIELLENGRGETVLSRRNTRRKQAWRRVKDAMENEGVLEGEVTARVRGGYSVSLDGLRAFLPGSLVDIFPQSDPVALVGAKVEVRPIKVNMARGSLVVSRRAVMERAMLEVKDNNMMDAVEAGARFTGTVRAVVEYGAFVEIAGGIYGLLHITDISWKHTTSIHNVLSVGDEAEVVVLSVDKEKGRISLGMKQLQPNPWEFFDRAHPVGSRTFGKVTRVLEYGVFVEVEEGVQGLVHSSEMSWTRKNPNPLKLHAEGDEVEVMILEIDTSRRRISLGIKQCMPNPWQEFAVAYRKGDRITGKVRSINEFGIFMELSGGIDGLVRLSELSYEKQGEEAARDYKKGQESEMMVLAIDAERERISLSVKQLGNTGFESFAERHLRGEKVRGKITAIIDGKGAQVSLEGNVRGFLPIGEIAEQRVEKIGEFVKEGEEHEFILLNSDPRAMQAVVSIKEKDRRNREQTLQERKNPAAPKSTFGAMLQAKIRESAGEAADETADETAEDSAAPAAAAAESVAESAGESVSESVAEPVKEAADDAKKSADKAAEAAGDSATENSAQTAAQTAAENSPQSAEQAADETAPKE